MKLKKIALLLICSLLLISCNLESNEVSVGELYSELLESGEEMNHNNFTKIQQELNEVKTKSGAKYVYLIMPILNDKASTLGDPYGDYMLTIDGSEVAEEWGIIYHNEVQFTDAWLGNPSAARSAWSDGEDAYCWSAFAPIYDSNKNIVALLGIDYPATEAINEYPEWNRDGDNWNGYTDEITEVMPEKVKDAMTTVLALAAEYAEKLSK